MCAGIYGYYGYDDIESAIYEETDNPGGDPALENDARLLLRLAVCLKTERLVLMRRGNKPFEAAAKGAGIHCLKIAGPPIFLQNRATSWSWQMNQALLKKWQAF